VQAKRLLAAFGCILLALQLSGCGFQLRSWEMGSAYKSVGLDSAGRFDIEPALRRALAQTGVPVVENDAELVLELLDSGEELRTASVSGAARTAEFQLFVMKSRRYFVVSCALNSYSKSCGC